MNKIKRVRKIEFIDQLAYHNRRGNFNGKLCLSSFITYFSAILMQAELGLADDDFINTIKMIFAFIFSYSLGVKLIDSKKFKLADKKMAMIEDILQEKGIEVSFDDAHEIILKRTNDIRVDVCFEDKMFECTKESIRYIDYDVNLNVTEEIQNVLRK